jgi:hypothetical protein
MRYSASEQSLIIAKAYSAEAMVELADSRYFAKVGNPKSEVMGEDE